MESAILKPPISATNWRNPFPIKAPFDSRRKISFKSSRLSSRIISSFKKSDFEEFQGNGRPLRLLPASEVEYFAESLQEKHLESITLNGGSRSLYKITLRTSNIDGSSLSDRNARILLCLIDGNGDSLLQRIPSRLALENDVQREKVLFRKGSVDKVIFEGPDLEKVQALWISVSSGQWRLGGVTLTVILKSQPLFEDVQYDAIQYDYNIDDILLGDGGDKSMVALTPSGVTELSGTNPGNLLNNSFSETTSLSEEISKEEGMKEYTDLKLSLLLYDTALIFIGASLASISSGESSAFAFSLGGVLGFLYLLLVQRSVDELPTEELISGINSEGNSDRLGAGINGPLVTFAAIVVFSGLVVKYSNVGASFVLTPKELLVGMMGFLTSKVAVVLAAFKPLPLSLREKD